MAARDEAARDHHGFSSVPALGDLAVVERRASQASPPGRARRPRATWPRARPRHGLPHAYVMPSSTSATRSTARFRHGLPHAYDRASRTSTACPHARLRDGLARVRATGRARVSGMASSSALHDDGHRPRPRARPPALAAHRRCKATAIIPGLAHVYCGAPGTGNWATGVVHAFTLVHRDARHRRMHRARPRRRS